MKKNKFILLSAFLLNTLTAPVWADDNNGVKQALTVNDKTIERTVTEIRIDGNNAILCFTDGDNLAVDMRTVKLSLSYDETTGISRLLMNQNNGKVKAYKLGGQPINEKAPRTGVHVVNGKKVLIKNK